MQLIQRIRVEEAGRTTHRRAAATALLVAALLSLSPLLTAGRRRPGPPPHPEVLIVVNEASPVSVAIGDYYRQQRNVPASNVVKLSIPLSDPTLSDGKHESISRNGFETLIRDPIQAFLESNDLVDQIQYIVTTKGVPLKAGGTIGENILADQVFAAVDAELSLLFTGLDGSPGLLANPYFESDESFQSFRDGNPAAPPRYLVARLTGYQEPIDSDTGVPADVKSLIDRAQEADTGGTWLVDEDPNVPAGRRLGNSGMLAPAALALKELGAPVTHETTATYASGVSDIRALAGWGSNATGDPGPPFYGQIDGKLYPGTFTSRAISVDIVSTNARSFTHPPSYGQSLIADLIRLGVAGAAGHVREPTLGTVARPQVLLRSYAMGVTAGVAFYQSLPYLGWTNVYIGDPLMRVHDPLAATGDADGDGVADISDNCTRLPNPGQRDTNGDGFGNRCDGDVNDSGVVDTTWNALDPNATGPCPKDPDLEAICRTIQFGRYNRDHDLDGNGAVDPDDFSLALFRVFHPPGPSGLVP